MNEYLAISAAALVGSAVLARFFMRAVNYRWNWGGKGGILVAAVAVAVYPLSFGRACWGNAPRAAIDGSAVIVDVGNGRMAVIDPGSGTLSLRTAASLEEFVGHSFVAESASANLGAAIDPWQPFVNFFPRDAEGSPKTPAKEAPGRRIEVAPNPQALAFTPDGKRILVACDPPGRADRLVCFVDVKTGAVSRRPIPGSSNLRGVAVEPNGKFALVAHLVPKSDLPATQIEQGWVFTNAISYVPLDESQAVVTLPLDQRTHGYANPEGVAISPDGKRAYVAHAGADMVSVIDLPALVEVADGVASRSALSAVAAELLRRTDDGKQRARTEEQASEERRRANLTNLDVPAGARFGYGGVDLQLARRYVRARIAVGSNPRGIAVSADSRFVAVVNRLDDSISIIDAESNSVKRTIALPGDNLPLRDDKVRSGEKLFHSGKLAFSGQFSCASCHPDGQTDGLNWDLPADGFNNFHNTKSLLGTTGTAPYGWTGTSPDLRERFAGTLRQLFQHHPTEEENSALEAYLTQLNYPATLPPRVDPKSAAAQRGRALFQGAARCADCHRGTKLTDRQRHDVGTGSAGESAYDTPSLVRVSETAPYLHDGRAETIEEIFSRHNPAGTHGNAAELSPEQLKDLVEYLKSL